MKLSSYVVTHDYGFAPNPFGGVLTLATCKPKIRRYACRDNWVMGTGSKHGIGSERLIFIGRISSVIPIEQYGLSEKYKHKVPTRGEEDWKRRGDNIYYKDMSGSWVQRDNHFHGQNAVNHDLSGVNVLVCEHFWYFGDVAPTIPEAFRSLIKIGPNHKDNIGNPAVPEFLNWVQTYREGIHGAPSSIKKL